MIFDQVVRYFIIVLLSGWLCFMSHECFVHGEIIESSNQTVELCRRWVTFQEMKDILQRHPCVAIDTDSMNSSRRRVKRWPSDNTENKINALNGVINEHRTMINYLMNTSINATFMKDSIDDHHENTGPSMRSWRDIIDLICMTFLFGGLIYVLVFRCGFSPCNRCLISLSKYFIPRVQQKQQTQQELQEQIKKQIESMQHKQHERQGTIKKHSIHRKKVMYPSTPSMISDIVHENNGYVTN